MEARCDGDLMVCEKEGVAYQKDMRAGRVAYDASYLAKFEAYDERIAAGVNAGRCALLRRHLLPGTQVLDYGAGSGAFVRDAVAVGFSAMGFDVIPESAAQLRADGAYADSPEGFEAVCLWDVLEHLEDPGAILQNIRWGAYLFVSIPVFDDLGAVRRSKHYRPGEHLLHFTVCGLVNWMAHYGFRVIETSDHETRAGRDSIGAFVFRRDINCVCCAAEINALKAEIADYRKVVLSGIEADARRAAA